MRSAFRQVCLELASFRASEELVHSEAGVDTSHRRAAEIGKRRTRRKRKESKDSSAIRL